MSAFDPRPAATALMANRAARRPAGPLDAAIAPRSVGEGVAVQRVIAERVGAVPPGGFKIGATGSRMQAFLGLPGPAAAFMRAQDILVGGSAVELGRFAGAQVECEIAVHLARDLPPGFCSIEAAAEAVGAISAAIEIVENRYGPPPIGDLAALGTPTLIADQVYHAACCVGPPVADWRGLDLAAMRGRLLVDEVERDSGLGADLLGHPLRALAWLAGSETAASFGGLRAGQVVMLGSVTPSVIIERPCVVRVAFDGLPAADLRFT